MDLKLRLSKIGFEEKEIQIYLATLKLGTSTVVEIAKKSDVKRPTCYVVLETLVKKGLVSVRQTKKHTLYTPAHPKKILTDMQDKKRKAEEILPELLLMYKDNIGKPSVQVVEGVQGMSQVYVDLMEYLKKGKEVLLYGKFQHTTEYPEFNENLDEWLKCLENKKYKARELIYNDEEYEREYIKKALRSSNPNRKIRIFKKTDNVLAYDNVIYDNKLIMFNSGESMFALIIDSAEIANSYRAMFEYAWQEGTAAEDM